MGVEAESGDRVVVVDNVTPLPKELSAIIGDVLHNLRTALDTLVVAAVRANGGEPRFKTGFPLYENRELHEKNAEKRLQGAPPIFVDRALALESHADNASSRISPIGELNNMDKHVELVPTTALASVTGLVLADTNGNEVTANWEFSPTDTQFKVARWTGTDTSVMPKIVETGQFSVDMQFAHRPFDERPVVASVMDWAEACEEFVSEVAAMRFAASL